MKMISFFITAKSGKGALLICHQQLFDRDLENNPEVWSRTQINNQSHQAYWFIPVISAPGRLIYTESLRPVWENLIYTVRSYLRKSFFFFSKSKLIKWRNKKPWPEVGTLFTFALSRQFVVYYFSKPERKLSSNTSRLKKGWTSLQIRHCIPKATFPEQELLYTRYCGSFMKSLTTTQCSCPVYKPSWIII